MKKLPYDILCFISIVLSFTIQAFYRMPWFMSFIAIFSIGWFIGKNIFPQDSSLTRKRGLFFIPRNYALVNLESKKLRYSLLALVFLGIIFAIVMFQNNDFYMMLGFVCSIGIPVIIYDIFSKEFIEPKKDK